MSPTQQRIADTLAARPADFLSAYELRDLCTPGRVVKNIHVQIHRMRGAGVEIATRRGVYGGYCWGRA